MIACVRSAAPENVSAHAGLTQGTPREPWGITFNRWSCRAPCKAAGASIDGAIQFDEFVHLSHAVYTLTSAKFPFEDNCPTGKRFSGIIEYWVFSLWRVLVVIHLRFSVPHALLISISSLRVSCRNCREKRALWSWQKARSSIASRWCWLQAQIQELEYKIRQHNDLHRQVSVDLYLNLLQLGL